MDMGFLFGGDENDAKQTSRSCTILLIHKNHWIIQFKWVSCILCELYLNKAVNKFKKKKKESTTTYLQGFQEVEGPQVDEREGILDPVGKVPPKLASVPVVTPLVWKLKSTFEINYHLSKRRNAQVEAIRISHKPQICPTLSPWRYHLGHTSYF